MRRPHHCTTVADTTESQVLWWCGDGGGGGHPGLANKVYLVMYLINTFCTHAHIYTQIHMLSLSLSCCGPNF